MIDENLILIAVGVVGGAALLAGIVRTLMMEDDEQPEDRVKGLEEYAKDNGFTFAAEENRLAQSRLPALRLFAGGSSIAHHVMTRDDGRFETMIFDLGYRSAPIGITVHTHDHRSDPWGLDWGVRHYEGDDDGIRFNLTEGSIVLRRTVFAFRLPRTGMPEVVIDMRHRADLAQIPATLHAGFQTVWCMETGEDWIVFHRSLVRARSTREATIGDAFAAAEELRDAILAHWGLI